MSNQPSPQEEVIDLLGSDSEAEQEMAAAQQRSSDDDNFEDAMMEEDDMMEVEPKQEEVDLDSQNGSPSPSSDASPAEDNPADSNSSATPVSTPPIRRMSSQRHEALPQVRTNNQDDNSSADVQNQEPENEAADEGKESEDEEKAQSAAEDSQENPVAGSKNPVVSLKLKRRVPVNEPEESEEKDAAGDGQETDSEKDSVAQEPDSAMEEEDASEASEAPAEAEAPSSSMPPPFSPESMKRVKTPEIERAEEIIKKRSPYELDYNAETNEPAFERMNDYMSPYTDPETNEKCTNPGLLRCHGDKLSESICKFRQYLRTESDECFNPDWATKTGKLPGLHGSWVPPRQVLFSLYSERFIEAPDGTLAKVIKWLKCRAEIQNLIKQFKLEELYPFMAVSRSPTYTKRARDCMKAEIFCARAYSILTSLRMINHVNYSLERKIHACLSLMETNIERTKTADSAAKKLKDALEIENEADPEAYESTSFANDDENDDSSSPEQGPVKEISVRANAKTTGEDDSEASEVTTNISPTGGRSGTTARKTSKHSRNISSHTSASNSIENRTVHTREEREQSLMKTYAIVQEQYSRLEQTILMLTDSIQEHRDLCIVEARAEIRAELKRELEQQRNNNSTENESRKKSRQSM